MFGKPKSTLHDHSRGKLEGVKQSGIDPSLNVAEEQALTNYMKYMASRGMPITLS
ncbi:hypothetical protein DPMN_127853 [Dreissena polymorpha]|uniref:Uncharacterized protein n=1 Tax=Dreissena polymorpha TaxID=45954 RepID=A0A9D4JVU6_DREPO|nr:hypothetical protein DPMN_127853 [Dreissena polymorpha]